MLVVVSLGFAVYGVVSTRKALGLASEALGHSAEANDIATKALVQDRGMAKLAFEDFVRAREPSAFVVGMALDHEWPAIFDRKQDLFLTVLMRNTGPVVARRVGLVLSRVVVRDRGGRVLATGMQRERLSPVRPGEDRKNEVRLIHGGGSSGPAHNIEIVGRIEVLGDLMQQRPEPFRWISDRVRGGGTLIETWPGDEPDTEDWTRDEPEQLQG